MTRYFFHVRDGDSLEHDPEGTELPTVDAAVNEAMKAAREILSEKMLNGEVIDGQRFEITTEDGVLIREIPFRSVIRLE